MSIGNSASNPPPVNPAASTKPGWLASLITKVIARKGGRYWGLLTVVVLAWAGFAHFAHGLLGLDDRSSVIFQKLVDWTALRSATPRYVRLVLIQDDQFYGELGGRRPTRRDYLAKVVDRLVDLNAHVIALDFDLRLPNPNMRAISPEYKAETDRLICSIKRAAARGKKIVLATPISFVRGTQDYQRDDDTYQLYGLCGGQQVYDAACEPSSAGSDADRNIRCGHISLSRIRVRIPERLRLADGKRLDSFAIAIARADRADSIQDSDEDDEYPVRLVQFIAESKFRNARITTSSGSIFSNGIDRDIFDSKAVIVGADWSEFAHSRGPRVDLHATPLAPMVGAIMHANFAEALLDSRLYRPLPHYLATIVDIVAGFATAILLSIFVTRRGKGFVFAGVLAVILIAQWFLLLELGVFFDAILLAAGIALHSILERDKHPDQTVAIAAHGGKS